MNNEMSAPIVSLEDLNRLRRFNEVRLGKNGGLFWSESIDGHGTLFRAEPDGSVQILSGELDVRGTVGYGGGEFDLGSRCLVFAEKSGRLYRVDLNRPENPKAVTPAFCSAAAPALSPDEQWVLYVYQQGETDGLAICRTHGLTWPSQLVLGADFYMQPTWHPSGEMIAWAEWNHPHMPWEASVVKFGKLGGMQLRLLDENWIDGAPGAAACQPRFSPDGKWLSYIMRDGDWDSLMLYNLKKRGKRILLPPDGCHLCQPNWIQGMHSYAWSADSKRIYYLSNLRGVSSLWKVELRSGKSTQIGIEPTTWATQLDCAGDDLAFLGISGQAPKQIWEIKEGRPFIAAANALPEIFQDAISQPEEISFTSGSRHSVYGFYYPPVGSSADTGSAPPLILDIHGGPTGQDLPCFSGEAAYFTTRGYAYALLNYRGSSGYGYSYLEALRRNWGVVDVEDTFNFTHELIRRGLADPKRLVISGSSAGGFTALNVLIRHPGLFKAALCSYAVSNLVDDAQHTHKFERYYHHFLTGNLHKDYQRFVDRSPIFHIDRIQDPVALFHGDGDKVVAPSQSVEIYTQLSTRGIPCTLKIYEGEGHGFRLPETLRDYYQQVEAFLKEHLG